MVAENDAYDQLNTADWFSAVYVARLFVLLAEGHVVVPRQQCFFSVGCLSSWPLEDR